MKILIDGKEKHIRLGRNDRYGFTKCLVYDGYNPIAEHSIPTLWLNDGIKSTVRTGDHTYAKTIETK